MILTTFAATMIGLAATAVGSGISAGVMGASRKSAREQREVQFQNEVEENREERARLGEEFSYRMGKANEDLRYKAAEFEDEHGEAYQQLSNVQGDMREKAIGGMTEDMYKDRSNIENNMEYFKRWGNV